MLSLYTLPGSFDFPSLDPESLVVASYLQLLKPNEWQHLITSDSGSAPNGCLPYLTEGPDQFSSSAILPHLLRSSELRLNALQASESAAFHSLLDTTLLPLVLHSLYSLPQNWSFLRPHLSSALPFPSKYYKPEQIRSEAKFVVESQHPEWWGLGGESEKEEEAERRRKKVLLEAGTDAWKERKEEERKENKERIKKTFGEGKIAAAAREVFTALEMTLASSSTPFFFSSSSPTPLDAHLSSLLSLILYIPLPQPLLADLINASFPRLWTHSALLRRTLWSASSPAPAPTKTSLGVAAILADFTPSWSVPYWSKEDGIKTKQKKKTKKDQDFERKRWYFAGVVAVGIIGWGLGTGAIPLPGRPGIWATEEEDGEYEWVEVDENENEEE